MLSKSGISNSGEQSRDEEGMLACLLTVLDDSYRNFDLVLCIRAGCD